MPDEKSTNSFEYPSANLETLSASACNQAPFESGNSDALQPNQTEHLEFPSYSDPEHFWAHAHRISLNVASRLCIEMTDSHSSEDIANGVVERLLRNPSTLQRIIDEQGSGNAKAYVAAITRNLVIDRVRRKNKIPMRSIDNPDYPLLDFLPSTANPGRTF